MIFAIISMMLLGLVDTFYISMLGTVELVAASFVMPIYLLTVSMALGIGMALGSITSRLIGEQKHDEAARFITDAHILTLLFTLIIAFILFQLIQPLFTLMGANDDAMPHIKGYMHIILVGTPMLVLTLVGNNTLRATGNIKASAKLSMLLSILNFILDPLFIFGLGFFPALGMPGAALATVIAGTVTWLSSFYLIGFQEKLFDFAWPKLSILISNWRQLLSIAVPAIVANIMTPLAAAVMTAIIARISTESVAGFGVGTRIESMSLIVVFALSSTLPMFIGQNIGAGRGDRAYQALILCLRFVVIFQIGIYLLLLLCAPVISTTFSDNQSVTQVIRTYLMILPLTYSAHAVVILAMVALNVLKRPRTALLITIIRLVLLYLPLAYLGSLFWGITGLFVGAACGNVMAGLIAFRIVKRVCEEQGLENSGLKQLQAQQT